LKSNKKESVRRKKKYKNEKDEQTQSHAAFKSTVL